MKAMSSLWDERKVQYKQIPNKKSYGDEGHFIFLPNTKKKSCGLHPSKRKSKLFQRHLINFRMGVKSFLL